MNSSRRPAAAGAAAPPGPHTGTAADAVTAVVSAILITGLAGWARPQPPPGPWQPVAGPWGIPWHTVLGAGYLLTALWLLGLAVARRRAGAAVIPAGYRGALAALPVIPVCLAADVLWRSRFGTDTGLAALFEPGHVGLATALFVIASASVRAAAARTLPGQPVPLRQLWPALLSTGTVTALVLLCLGYANAITYPAATIVDLLSQPDGPAVRGLASALVISAAVLLIPLLYLARRWRIPFGAATLSTAPPIAVSAAGTGGGNLSVLVALAIAAVVVDLLALCLDPCAARPAAYRAFATGAAFFTWSLYIGVAAAAAGRVPDTPGMWIGAPVVTAALAWLLAALMLPAPAASPEPVTGPLAPDDPDPVGLR
ncbi:hypothetical protein [Nocardia sp. alder85J]|uniref:hypothetical protein n=1 Tax=Nocardia sp. alder85J TaxID=2862949 RepID=UPI001CD38CF9|nr:hypothetical protein [Nocardia sp. alder85J]MCX4091676.1 hypothetical protein [Nocardia sp. alder85J]